MQLYDLTMYKKERHLPTIFLDTRYSEILLSGGMLSHYHSLGDAMTKVHTTGTKMPNR